MNQEAVQVLNANNSNYVIIKPFKYGNTTNQLYLAHKQNMPNNPLYVLKKYNRPQGYLQEKTVFSFQQIYAHFYVDNSDMQQFNVLKYSKLQSLYDVGPSVKYFPLPAVKFYIHSLFSQLCLIHDTLHIPYRSLYHSDIIFSEDYKLYIVGWSKIEPAITQQELIYDCAEIMYYMITYSVPQKRVFYVGSNNNRFLTPDYWDLQKRTKKTKFPYFKYLPQEQNQFKQWVEFLKLITCKRAQKLTLDQVLKHNFFANKISYQQARQIFRIRYEQSKSKQKQKCLHDFELNMKRGEIIKRQKKQSTRDIQSMYEKIKCPVYVPLQNSKQKIKQFVERFIDSKLSLGLNNCDAKIFTEDWIELQDYQIKDLKYPKENQIRYEIVCDFKFIEKQGLIPDEEKVTFELIIYIDKWKKQGKCIKGFKLNQTQNKMHKLMCAEFSTYLCQSLIDSLIYNYYL